MKKIVWTLLFSMLLMTASPFLTLVSADEALPPLWDGTSADGFAGGDGSEQNPFRIENAAQLAYLCDAVNAGESFYNKHLRLCADIRLNDESFTFEPDTGLVKVTDGKHVAYYGTGYKGDDSGDNVLFDKNASAFQSWYNEKGEVIDTYPGTLNNWTPIGNSTLNNGYFGGILKGNGHAIIGLFVDSRSPYAGLFSTVRSGILAGIHIKECLSACPSATGSLLGRAGSVELENCTASGVVVGKTQIGGLIGLAELGGMSMFRLQNNCTVVGNHCVGGITGESNKMIKYCLNKGEIYGSSKTGGISGYCSTVGIQGCTNMGRVRATNMVGGIAGELASNINKCHNLGDVAGNYNVGGIAGKSTYYTVDCLNSASVVGSSYVGGICGNAYARGCQNNGAVSGKDNVGGIVGFGYSEVSINNGSVSGDLSVGGIVGMGSAKQVENHADITGAQKVGGICGNFILTTSPMNNNLKLCNIENSYNTGTVTGQSIVGGIVGHMESAMTNGFTTLYDMHLLYAYNTGAVRGASYVGAVAGKINGTPKQLAACYLLGSATDRNGVVQSGAGCENTSRPSSDNPDQIKGCTLEEMAKEQTYTDFDFKNIWEEDFNEGNPPTLKQTSDIQHSPRQEAYSYYWHEGTACGESVTYHVSCTCDAILDELFSTPGNGEHKVDTSWIQSASAHWKCCTLCHSTESEALHTYEKIKVVTLEAGGYEVLMHCSVCEYEARLPFEFDPPVQTPPEEVPPKDDPTVQEPLQEPTQTPQKAAMKLDLRFMLLLSAGIVLGVMGSYAVSVVKKVKKDVKKKKTDFI